MEDNPKSVAILEVQTWVFKRHGFLPHPDWIASCKRLYGLPFESVQQYQTDHFETCPSDKVAAITAAFRHFGLLPKATDKPC